MGELGEAVFREAVAFLDTYMRPERTGDPFR
jgi:hypothetical protein